MKFFSCFINFPNYHYIHFFFAPQVLLWLKQWDSCVFGSEVRTTTDEVLSALRRHSSGFQRQKLSEMNYLRKDKGRRFSEENFKHSKSMDPENGNWKGIKELWNKKARSSGPPEQKVSCRISSNLYSS